MQSDTIWVIIGPVFMTDWADDYISKDWTDGTPIAPPTSPSTEYKLTPDIIDAVKKQPELFKDTLELAKCSIMPSASVNARADQVMKASQETNSPFHGMSKEQIFDVVRSAQFVDVLDQLSRLTGIHVDCDVPISSNIPDTFHIAENKNIT